MARQRRLGEPELSEGVRLLDRYSILDRVGSGGMASIYRATDNRLDRVVCVKLLRTTFNSGSAPQTVATGGDAVFQATYDHFLREALALSKLQHPNTLRIYDFGYLDVDGKQGVVGPGQSGAPFQVSEYLDGGNLETLVRLRGPLSFFDTVAMLESVTGAVAEAHEHGIIHRDIKPSNILFARVRGELVPKLADFGIAHSNLKAPQNGADGSERVSTVALFSPRWAAPEQLCGAPEGPRTDVYALGLLTAFMLAGRVVFNDEDVRVTFNDRVRGDTLVRSRIAQLGLAPSVSRVLEWSMTARPTDRIATAPEMLEALRAAMPTPVSFVGRSRPASEPPTLDGRTRSSYPPPFEPTPTAPRAYPPTQAAPHVPPSPMPHIAPAPPPPPPPVNAGELALEVEAEGGNDDISQVAVERVEGFGQRRMRYVQVHERLDLSFVDPQGGPVRVRVTMLPGRVSLNIKGLTCFVARPGQRPTPAVSVTQDGSLELVSSARQVLGDLSWSFGVPGPQGHAFVVDGRSLLVPYSDAQQAVVLSTSRGQDIVVMCRR